MAANSTQIEQTLSLTATYSLITGAAVITDNSAWGSIGIATPDTVKILLQIYDPTGELFYENAGWNAGDYSSPDLSLLDTTYTFTLPTDIAGDYVQGQYLVKTKCQVVEDSATTVVTKDFYQTVCPCCNSIKISVEGTVVAGTTQVKLTDNTNYKTYSALSRVMILYPPPTSGQANQTGTNVDIILYSGTVYTGVWTWKLTSDVTFTDADGVSTTCRLTKQGTFNVQYAQLCKVLCLIEKYRTQTLLPALSNKNSTQLLQNYLLAMSEFQLAEDSYTCGKSLSIIEGHIAKVYEILGIDADCDCGCDDGVSQPLLSVTTVDGTDGTDGSQILYGSGAPSGGTGAVGDTYINTANGFVYKKTGASTWTYELTIIGANGANGANAGGLLMDSNTDSVTTTNTWETWAAKTATTDFTNDQKNLVNVGDQIRVYARFKTATPNPTTPQEVRLTLNGSVQLMGLFTGNFFQYNTCEIWCTISKLSDTTASVISRWQYGDDSGALSAISIVAPNYMTRKLTVALLDTAANNNVIGAYANDGGSAAVTCEAMSAEIISVLGGTQSSSTNIKYMPVFTTTIGVTTYANVIGSLNKTLVRVYLDGVLLTSSDWNYDNATDTLTFNISITGASEVAGDYI